MAAIASHHVRLALFRYGWTAIARATSTSAEPWSAQGPVDQGREHDPGDEQRHLRRHPLGPPRLPVRRTTASGGCAPSWATSPTTRPSCAGFESIDRGRRVLDDESSSVEARLEAEQLIWEGNVQLLEHEQRALVQPHFDTLSCAFARLVSMGSDHDLRRARGRSELASSPRSTSPRSPRGAHVPRAARWPRITNYDDRWSWIVRSVVPKFRRLDADMRLVDVSLRRIFADGRTYSLAAVRRPARRVERPCLGRGRPVLPERADVRACGLGAALG